jgi:hypothetical protein
MDWSKKIDKRRYVMGTLLLLGVAIYMAKARFPDATYLLLVTIGSALNQYLMFLILGKVLKQTSKNQKLSPNQKSMFWFQISLKFILLGTVFYVLIVYARHMVAQGLILYTFQLIILILSIKNIADSMKKGSRQ